MLRAGVLAAMLVFVVSACGGGGGNGNDSASSAPENTAEIGRAHV